MGEFVFVDCLPVSRGGGVRRCGLEDDCRDTVCERTVDNVAVRFQFRTEQKKKEEWGNSRMSRDPPNIGHATELVTGMDVKNVFDGESGAEEIPSGRVNDTFGFTSGSRGLV